MFQHLLAKLDDPACWFGMAIRHEVPHIDRIWLAGEDGRFCLHKIYPLTKDQTPYFHPHPWACETHILHGSYYMNLGYGSGSEQPPVACRLLLAAGSSYVMNNPDAWHTVEPVGGPVYTVFKISTKWQGRELPVACRRPLRLSRKQISALLQDFSEIFSKDVPSPVH